jgi:hypothetical protein
MTGLTTGKQDLREGWTYVSCSSELPGGRFLRTRGGEILVRDPIGFPFTVVLHGAGRIGQPAALRLMKAFSLAVRARAAKAGGRRPAGRITIEIGAPSGSKAAPPGVSAGRGRGGLVVGARLDPRWVEKANVSLEDLRRAVDLCTAPALGGRIGKIRDAAVKVTSRRSPAKVLFFGNMFMKDVDRGDALQLNPGIHYLVSPLRRKGVSVLLLDGKLPLQDVCARPPDVMDDLSTGGFLTDPAELERALAANPDLTLVGLTVLERSFGQVRSLCRFIRERSRAFIAVGGVFPTLTPEHAFVHLPEVNFLVRGDGEEILPSIVEAVAGRTVDDGLDDAAIEKLAGLAGLAARCGDTVVTSSLGEVNRVRDLDRSGLDFSLLEKRHVLRGLSLSTSRGCIYNCHFCSVMDKKVWRGKSAASVLGHVRDYERRLVEIFGSKEAVPAEARSVQVWDDDFFIHPGRAAAILAGFARAGFTVTFIQGTVNSFFRRRGATVTNELDENLLDAIPPAVFTRLGGLKMGTENFCDEELRRIGKPYRFERIRTLALALARRGIDQEHYLILCNRRTTLENLLDNFEKIAELRWCIGGSFKVLEPSWLMALFPTVHYKACRVKGTDRDLPLAGKAAVPGYGEFDYPFVVSDRPERQEAFEIIRRFPKGMHFGMAGPVDDPFAGVHDTVDADYLLVFEHIPRVLLRRRSLVEREPGLASRSEQARIDACLAGHFASTVRVPAGVLRRVAPALAASVRAGGEGGILLPYVEEIFRDVAASIGKSAEGVELDVREGGETVRFLVQRKAPGVPCAFASRNLAFVIRSPLAAGQGPGGPMVKVVEKVMDIARRKDTFPLE